MSSFDHARVMWASPRCREIWQPKFRQITESWVFTQLDSVLEGVRDGAWEFIPDHMLNEICNKYSQKGLSVVPLSFGNGKVRIYCGNSPTEFLKAHNSGDDQTIGRLLGFPECCIQHFKDSWKGQNKTDPTLHMNGVDGPMEANILARWMGIRYVPHLPCSGICKASVEFGSRFRHITSKSIRDYKDEILSWPVRWTANHGALEIAFPVCKVQGITEYTRQVVTLDREGFVRPHEAPNGVVHPFGGAARALPLGRKYEKPAPNIIGKWEFNGFANQESMQQAHAMILSSIQTTASDVICDLGAGDGTLLSQMNGRKIGVESDLKRASSVVSGVEMVHSKIQDYTIPREVTKVLLAPIRLIEQPCSKLIEQLKRVPNIYLYAYRDTLNRYGGMREECEAAGLNGYLTPLNSTPQGEIVQWTPA